MGDCLPMPVGAYVPASTTWSIRSFSGILSSYARIDRRVFRTSMAGFISTEFSFCFCEQAAVSIIKAADITMLIFIAVLISGNVALQRLVSLCKFNHIFAE